MGEEEILAQLDAAATDFVFPMLDNGYDYHVTQRLTALRDEARWALVLEIGCCHNRDVGVSQLSLVIHRFGNCLGRAPGTDNADTLHPFGDGPSGPLFVEADDGALILNPEARDFRLRDEVHALPDERAHYRARGVTLVDPTRVEPFELMRGLLPEHRPGMLATPEELRRYLPAELPVLLALDDWHHPDLAGDERPSESTTFQQLACALVTGDAAAYRPMHPPNTHWSLWPDGGAL